ncbi:hypothetical protein AB1L07_07730 [Niallia alba]|nr:hypothetical protein [Niallia circulans]
MNVELTRFKVKKGKSEKVELLHNVFLSLMEGNFIGESPIV